MQNEDRRIRRTKKAMAEALAALLQEKPLSNISVREITDLADINRGTFYLHYRDVYDMVEQLQNEIFERFNEIFDDYQPRQQTDNLFPMLVELFEMLSERSIIINALIGRNGDAAFVDRFKNMLREKCFANAQKVLGIKNDEFFNYFYHFIVSGCIGICSAWLSGGMRESPVEMATLVERFIISSVKALL